MYKSIMYVVDGSVDVDQLKQDLGDDVYVVVYRQGSIPPQLVQPEKPLESILDSEKARLINKLNCVEEKLNEAYKLIDDIFVETT
jgi:hypothetical protein